MAETASTGDRAGAACTQISVAKRLVAAIALLPIVPAVAWCATQWCVARRPLSSFDDIRYFNLWLAVFWVGATVLVWRKMILWTLGRTGLTALVGLVPLFQLIYAQPLWNAGCVSDDFLRIGQGNVGIGVWIWLSVWVWWGCEMVAGKRGSRSHVVERAGVSLSPNAKRIIYGIGSIPVVFGAFVMAVIGLESLGISGRAHMVASFVIGASWACVVWIAIWRGAVRWSKATCLRTLGLALVWMGIPIMSVHLLADRGYGFWSDVCGAFPAIGWGGWMIETLRKWPMRDQRGTSDVPTPTCVECGYLLTGLTATRCPECGDERTLDELWRAQSTGGL